MELNSSYIFNLKPGDKITVSGPYGEFFIKDTKAAKIKEALKTHHKHTVGPEAMESQKNAKVSKVKQLKKKEKKRIYIIIVQENMPEFLD